MSHTVTLSDPEHEAVLRALLEALGERLSDAAAELDGLLPIGRSPSELPAAADVDALLRAVYERVAALRSLGWPVTREEA